MLPTKGYCIKKRDLWDDREKDSSAKYWKISRQGTASKKPGWVRLSKARRHIEILYSDVYNKL